MSRGPSRGAFVQHELAAARRQIAALARQLADLRQRCAHQQAASSLPALPPATDDRSSHHAAGVLDSMGEAFWETDEGGHVRHANRTLLATGGWSIEEVKGRSLDELFKLRGGGSLLDRLAQQGRLADVDIEVTDPWGSPKRMWLSAQFAETEREHRRVIRGVLRNVSAAAASPEPRGLGQLEAAMEAAGLGVWDWDVRADTVLASTRLADVRSGTAQATSGRPSELMALVYPDDVAAVNRAVEDHFTQEVSLLQFDARVPGRDRPWRWLRVCGRVIERSPTGEPWRAVGTIADLASNREPDVERDRTQRRRQDARRLEGMEHLAGGIAREFNDFFSVILGSAELALLETEPDHATWKDLQRVCSTAQRAADRCTQLIAGSGKGTLAPESLDLSRLVEDVWGSLCRSVGSEVNLTHVLEPAPLPFDADTKQLGDAVTRLVINAWEAMDGKPGTITVTTRRQFYSNEQLQDVIGGPGLPEREYVVLEVKDDGRGIDDTIRDSLFDPFFSTKPTGRGLGLFTTLGIVRAHRGALQVDSQPGRGTTVSILLPAKRGGREEKPHGAPLSERSWTASGNLLFIDDQGSVREVAGRMLEILGFDVVMAENGRVGLQLFRMLKPKLHAVMLDMGMPELSGEETLRQIRDLDPDVPVVVTGGHDVHQLADRLEDLNVSGTLQKPFRLSMLRDELRRALTASRGEASVVS